MSAPLLPDISVFNELQDQKKWVGTLNLLLPLPADGELVKQLWYLRPWKTYSSLLRWAGHLVESLPVDLISETLQAAQPPSVARLPSGPVPKWARSTLGVSEEESQEVVDAAATAVRTSCEAYFVKYGWHPVVLIPGSDLLQQIDRRRAPEVSSEQEAITNAKALLAVASERLKKIGPVDEEDDDVLLAISDE